MPRQRCCGLIAEEPLCRKFSPEVECGKKPVVVQLEELEAIRLKDIKDFEQAICASMMGLSRPTFQRILYSARQKIATALVEGRAIIIEGGNYIMQNRVFECVDCHHVWEVAPCTEGGKHGYEIACPQCGSMKKMKLDNGVKHACGGQQHQHGQGGCCGH
ncbi:hypothetical protein SPSIL_044780 [Sporomusa silvacetica DSM 10669]|uniref:Uncharacterized protein n=1 Tax=Sporomusa silvacetica DSM 10669 TaxID=1123289 RepID=A0ABZ3IRZ4_9FIRM|nr:DUF134 domain-containing protein [Sporomusa silvacetica]OZC20739.1 hypothetical protein SPSIL_16070 [Sporomusa silvacetica DSM 10669]